MKSILILSFMLMIPVLHAQEFNITASDGTSATGNIVVNGLTAATFELRQNSHISMTNLVFVSGINGVQVTSDQPDDADDPSIIDTTSYTFTVNSLPGFNVNSTTLSQSAYQNTIGNNDTAQWDVQWAGLAGVVSDIDNQIIADGGSNNIPDYADGASITSGNSFLTGYTHNNSDTWSITMPASSFTMNYVSKNTPGHAGVPAAQNNLNYESYREWITFGASVTQVPEPSSITLLALGSFGFIIRRKRQLVLSKKELDA